MIEAVEFVEAKIEASKDEVTDIGYKANQSIREVMKLVQEGLEDDEEEDIGDMDAWDDVRGGSLPVALVKKVRLEELHFMGNKKQADVGRVSEERVFREERQSPDVRQMVDTNKAEGEMKKLSDYDVRCRLEGRDFKGVKMAGTICLRKPLH